MKNVGTNLLGLQSRIYYDLDGTMEVLKDSGFSSVEICVLFSDKTETPPDLLKTMSEQQFKEMTGGIWKYTEAIEKIKAVRKHNLKIVSCHMMVGIQPEESVLRETLPLLISFGKDNNLKYYVLSLMTERKQLKQYHPVLKIMSEELLASGIRLLYHNHEMECQEQAAALKELLEYCPDIGLELDTGWALYAGCVPEMMIQELSDRIYLLHLKDILSNACEENRASCFTAIGEGAIDLIKILKAAEICPLDSNGIIIDQDASNMDIIRDLTVGCTNIKAVYDMNG